MRDLDLANAPTLEEARAALLRWRAHIRAHNHRFPRCSGCGCWMPVFDRERDQVTEEQMSEPNGFYVVCDFQPGDLVCWWCIMSEFAPDRPHIAGRA